MTELKVTSKKYNDKDELLVDNFNEAVNKGIESGDIPIPSGGTQLYDHHITTEFGSIDLTSTTSTKILSYNALAQEFGYNRIINGRRVLEYGPVLECFIYFISAGGTNTFYGLKSSGGVITEMGTVTVSSAITDDIVTTR